MLVKLSNAPGQLAGLTKRSMEMKMRLYSQGADSFVDCTKELASEDGVTIPVMDTSLFKEVLFDNEIEAIAKNQNLQFDREHTHDGVVIYVELSIELRKRNSDGSRVNNPHCIESFPLYTLVYCEEAA